MFVAVGLFSIAVVSVIATDRKYVLNITIEVMTIIIVIAMGIVLFFIYFSSVAYIGRVTYIMNRPIHSAGMKYVSIFMTKKDMKSIMADIMKVYMLLLLNFF